MNRSRFLLSLAAGTIAFWLALAVTEPPGPGLDPDAMAYLHAAGTLAHRGALRDVRADWVSADSTIALTRWPPGFPVAIARGIAAGAAPVQAARAVIAAAAFVTFATLVWLVSAAAGTAAAAVLALALLLTPAMAIVHENVLSEPLFLAALAVTLALMTRPRPAPLAAGAAAAVASMVRYAGLSAVAAVSLRELLRAGPARDRVRRAATAAAPGALVNLWWWTRAAHAGGGAAVREFSLYGRIGPTLREGARTVAAWLAPSVPPPWDAWVAIAVLVALGMMLGRPSALGPRPSGGDEGRGPRAEGLYVSAALLTACYAGLVLLARLVADPDIPLDERLLAPAMMLLTVMAVVWGASWWRRAPRSGRLTAALAGAAWCVGSALVTSGSVEYALETGNDYAGICWSGSPVTAWVREHGEGHALVSNASSALYFHAGRLAREMPEAMRADSLAMFRDTLAVRRAYVVLFDRSCAPTIEQPDSLVRALGLVEEARLPSGGIWRVPGGE